MEQDYIQNANHWILEDEYQPNDEGDVADETAKAVIVDYFNTHLNARSDAEAIQKSVDKICDENQLDNEQKSMVVNAMMDIANNLRQLTARVR